VTDDGDGTFWFGGTIAVVPYDNFPRVPRRTFFPVPRIVGADGNPPAPIRRTIIIVPNSQILLIFRVLPTTTAKINILPRDCLIYFKSISRGASATKLFYDMTLLIF
jgi:hypothetical protein